MNLPLLGHASLDAVFAWRPDGPVSARRFLAEAQALAARLPPGRHLLNVCQDRYHFAVGFAAGLLMGRTSLQPASQTAATLHDIRQRWPDLCCLCDGPFDSLDLSRLDYPADLAADLAAVREIPRIAADHVAARLFTSGSTGAPVPHDKTWGRMVLNGRAEAERLGLIGHPHSIVGTVPVQHAYGFESTFLIALHGAAPFWSGKPFYPRDIAAALAAVPPPRLLVITPFHLSSLLDTGIELPAVALLLSATAPLPLELAARAEQRFGAPLLEIFGSTESFQIASRRPTESLIWHLFPNVRLRQDGQWTTVYGGHVEGEVTLFDLIEPLPGERFAWHGRHADLVNIAGKRTSLAYLNHQAASIAGVADAAFFLPDDESDQGVTRLCAFVVAPGLDARQLMAALRQRVDAIFLPRPLVLVDRLPRNDTGKLPRAALLALYAEKVGHDPGHHA